MNRRRSALLLIAASALFGCGGGGAEESAPADAHGDFDSTSQLDSFSGSEDDSSGDGSGGSSDAADVRLDAAGDAIGSGDGSVEVGWPITQCNNGKDDDGDGLADHLDPECSTPYDNDEGSFGKLIAGDGEDGTVPCKSDCAFDGNSGSADDGCQFLGKCTSGNTHTACAYDPVAAKDPSQCPPQSSKCVDRCGALTPNGCDFLGCCDVFDSAGTRHRVRLNPRCSLSTLSDPAKCPPCEQIPEYVKPCDRCDVCLGKWTVPSDCEIQCKDGVRCGPGLPCPAGKWCLTGCCIAPAP